MNYDKENWQVPTGLTRKGRKIAFFIQRLAKEFNWNSGGQKVFWSPQEWSDKGERWVGTHLNILHEGGDHAPSFSLDYSYNRGLWSQGNIYEEYEAMIKMLRDKFSVYAENGHHWNSGVYDI